MSILLLPGGFFLLRVHALLREVSRHEAGFQAPAATEDVHESDLPARRGPPSARAGILPGVRAVSSHRHGILTPTTRRGPRKVFTFVKVVSLRVPPASARVCELHSNDAPDPPAESLPDLSEQTALVPSAASLVRLAEPVEPREGPIHGSDAPVALPR